MANEALQRGFIKVFEKLNTYKGIGNLGAWIKTIIVRKCIDLIKEQKKLKYDDLDKLENLELTDDVYNDDFEEIDYNTVLLLLEQMPIGYKTVFSMYILDGLKHDEIASALDISLATSRSQLFKARKMIKALVQDHLRKRSFQKCQT